MNSLFFSDFLAAAMALQIGQGYLPSNVRTTDSESECVRKLSASIVVHATDCSSGPMGAGGRNERDDHKMFAEPDEHRSNLNRLRRIASVNQ